MASVEKMSLPLQAPKGSSDEQARNWYRERNLIVCPVVLVTTMNRERTVNAAVKTDFMTVSSMTRYAFQCSPSHHTYQNIVETAEFVVNVPADDITDKILKAALLTERPCPPGFSEIEEAGLTPISAEKVKPPRVKECVAHYECILDWHKEGLIVGRVVAASVDKSFMDGLDERKLIVVGVGRVDSYGVVSEIKKWPQLV